jgi:hypothetical protein
MPLKNAGEQFIHQKDSKLHTSKEVEHEQKRKKMAGEETTQKPAEKLEAFFKVLEKTHGHKEPGVQERIKKYYHKNYVIKPDDIPEGYYENQKRLAREQGYGDIEITGEMKKQLTEVIITDQKSTLDNWINYFTSRDSDSFPMWAKYWAFNGMIKISSFDKAKHAFGKRDKGTVAPFPDLNREALAYVVDAIIKKANKEDIPVADGNQELKQLLDGANFGKLYAYAIEKITPTEENELLNTKGEWVKYPQKSDHMPLVKSIQSYGTGWCTAGESTAQAQLKNGDFYVYYSYDKQGKPIIPRVAIRMQGSQIGEVRGIAKEQNLDPYIGDVVKKKLAEFPDGKAYEKKAEDMKRLTQIEKKVKAKQELNKEDLVFLYEIDSQIEGFGYQKDPRIEEIRKERDPLKDAPIVFDCQTNQIAHNQGEINKNTRAFIGELYHGIFDELANVEHIYTSFPEGKIMQKEITIGGKNAEKLEQELNEKGNRIDDWAKKMMESKDFMPAKKAEKLDLVVLSVANLGFSSGATRQQIYDKAQELGLEIVPAEVGPQLRLQYEDQPMGEYLLVGSEPLAVSGNLNVFDVYHYDNGRWLDHNSGHPDLHWNSNYRWVFARK